MIFNNGFRLACTLNATVQRNQFFANQKWVECADFEFEVKNIINVPIFFSKFFNSRFEYFTERNGLPIRNQQTQIHPFMTSLCNLFLFAVVVGGLSPPRLGLLLTKCHSY